MRIFNGPDDIKQALGEEIGVSDWLVVDQSRIDMFADATGDHQWIHVDPEKAAAGPYGSTIAHGYLTLALVVPLMNDVYRIENRRMGVNYGLNKVRFPSPVPVGSRIRARVALSAVDDVASDGLQIVWAVTIEREGSDKPVCVAESVARMYF